MNKSSAALLLVLCAIYSLLAGLYPFKIGYATSIVDTGSLWTIVAALFVPIQNVRANDILLNVLYFLPWGVVCYMFLGFPRWRPWFLVVTAVLIGGSVTQYNLVLTGRAKKNWKSADLILAALYRLLAWKSAGGNQCYILANDEDQAGDDLELAKKLIGVNPVVSDMVDVKQKIIERRDGKGFLEILPAGDVVGSHGKTFLFAGFDEIWAYRTWDILEALQLDPSRPDAMQWITSYASVYHKPGVPLFDLFATAKKGQDPRLFFSWYGADYVTDPAFENMSPEGKANPSASSWEDAGYLIQQQTRLPSHKYRRLHLNLPGSPEGSAFDAGKVMDAVDRGVTVRLPERANTYHGFCDMSGGSIDDATLGIAHQDAEGRLLLDRIVDQGQRPPFDPRKAVERFATVLKEYGLRSVTGDKYAGETFRQDFQNRAISYRVCELTKSEIYEELEPLLNGGRVILLDHANLESQLLGLVWRANKIDHPGGEHDDYSNATAGALWLASKNQIINPRAVPMGVGNRTLVNESAKAFGSTLSAPEEAGPDPFSREGRRQGVRGITRFTFYSEKE